MVEHNIVYHSVCPPGPSLSDSLCNCIKNVSYTSQSLNYVKVDKKDNYQEPMQSSSTFPAQCIKTYFIVSSELNKLERNTNTKHCIKYNAIQMENQEDSSFLADVHVTSLSNEKKKKKKKKKITKSMTNRKLMTINRITVLTCFTLSVKITRTSHVSLPVRNLKSGTCGEILFSFRVPTDHLIFWGWGQVLRAELFSFLPTEN